ncbi:uncharacterized protein LOC8267791 [Ricinus communis]|uniref:DUF538 domain-containing protein n=1 Tax=Ricinus communis TaxID=3988 RepID=B9SY08_RICCO|nr:uncharacterized protein LOC8267791 [Ricinus communis]EEF31517.1 conserved hypothetical protein [Ricinus communis]|eukprot:XP_002530877.1 uncharacterized protein LOC8267791 [Ricinus communis]
MASLQISLYLLSLIFLSKTHLTFSLDPHRPFLAQSTIDVHDLLPLYGLPRGLLPENVKSYTLSPTGSFTIQLKTPCYVHFDRLVYYDKEIKGKLSYGAVNDVSGIQAKKLFLWVSVSAIEVSKDDGMIEFFVGPLSEKLPAAQFNDIPACKSKVALRTNLESI